MPFTSKLSILYVNNNSLTEIDDEIESLSHLAEIKLANNSWKFVLNTYKSEILYYMFAKGICLRFVCEEDVDADKVYDAFVSYSSEDEDWIADFLVPGLESGIPSYKLCLHNRDWAAGEFISDQIVRSVRNSRRTILVLTDNYFKSGWSRLEFDIAYQQGLKDKVRRLIAVVPNEVPDLSKIDQEFKTFITLTTYLSLS
uniref:TIR domain-containing protein n=1 Tax=Strigamia maritima TaxID=126957 RepID=T1JI80_STRMM